LGKKTLSAEKNAIFFEKNQKKMKKTAHGKKILKKIGGKKNL